MDHESNPDLGTRIITAHLPIINLSLQTGSPILVYSSPSPIPHLTASPDTALPHCLSPPHHLVSTLTPLIWQDWGISSLPSQNPIILLYLINITCIPNMAWQRRRGRSFSPASPGNGHLTIHLHNHPSSISSGFLTCLFLPSSLPST